MMPSSLPVSHLAKAAVILPFFLLYCNVVFTDGLAGLVHVLRYQKYMVLSPIPCVFLQLLLPLYASFLPSFAIKVNMDN